MKLTRFQHCREMLLDELAVVIERDKAFIKNHSVKDTETEWHRVREAKATRIFASLHAFEYEC